MTKRGQREQQRSEMNPSPCGLHEWRAASLGLVVDVGAPLNEQLHHVLVTLPAGEREGRVIVAARGDVDLGPRVEQELSGIKVTLPEVGTKRGEQGGGSFEWL